MNNTSAGLFLWHFWRRTSRKRFFEGKQVPNLSLEKCIAQTSLKRTVQRATLTASTAFDDTVDVTITIQPVFRERQRYDA